MELLEQYIEIELPYLIKNKIRLNFIGNLEKLPEKSKIAVSRAIDKTKNGSELILTLAISYGSKEEILNAVRKISEDVKKKSIELTDIDGKLFSNYLYTAGIPDPDLIIRTSGEERLSNFMLYQAAYAELYFTKTLWPDFRKKNLIAALKNYEKRSRRFGKT